MNYLYQNAIQKAYVDPYDQSQGVVLKVAKGEFECCPAKLRDNSGGLYDAVTAMNVRCAMTIKTTLTATLLETIRNAQLRFVPMTGGLRIQVLRSMDDLPGCQLHHFAAFIEEEQMLVVWEDDPEDLIKRVDQIEGSFVKGIWDIGEDDPDATENLQDWDDGPLDGEDTEACEPQKRTVKLLSAIATSVTLCLAMVCVAFGWRKLAIEIATDGHWMRIGLAVLFPVQMYISLVSNCFGGFPLSLSRFTYPNRFPLVLFSCPGRECHPDSRSNQADNEQLQILLREAAKTTPQAK